MSNIIRFFQSLMRRPAVWHRETGCYHRAPLFALDDRGERGECLARQSGLA
jgi:hypothetical protein